MLHDPVSNKGWGVVRGKEEVFSSWVIMRDMRVFNVKGQRERRRTSFFKTWYSASTYVYISHPEDSLRKFLRLNFYTKIGRGELKEKRTKTLHVYYRPWDRRYDLVYHYNSYFLCDSTTLCFLFSKDPRTTDTPTSRSGSRGWRTVVEIFSHKKTHKFDEITSETVVVGFCVIDVLCSRYDLLFSNDTLFIHFPCCNTNPVSYFPRPF